MKQILSISANVRQVVQATEAALIADADVNFGTGVPKKVYFTQGNLKEINAHIAKLTKSPIHKNKKYPLVALFRDFKEGLKVGTHGLDSSFRCKLCIFTLTTQNFTSDQREQATFIPILRPIMSELLNQFSFSVPFGMPTEEQMEIEKTDCFFYGTDDKSKNIFGDYVDAIEMELNLTLKNNICPLGLNTFKI